MVRLRESSSTGLFPIYLVLLTFALYLPALRVFFSLDDLQFLLKVAGYDANPLGLRRLLSVRLFFGAAWRLFDGHAWPYHLVSLLLHAANGWIVFLLARRLGLGEMAASAASILFIAAPVAFTPLHWISGIQEISMTFFALLAASFFLGRGYISMAASLSAAFLSLLCKESSFLLLPGLAVLMPVPRRRKVILGTGGLLIAVAYLWASGSFIPRPEGDAYETAFGINILWNLLTYSAWLVRLWDYFPDRIPEYQAGLAPWGMALPLIFGIVSVRFSKARIPLARASVLFVLLLLPVLPLVRHSYFYYLYLPLIPFCLLTGSLLGMLRRKPVAVIILVACIFYSAAQGHRHRRAELQENVLEDPILRYAETARNAVSSFRAENEIMQGELCIMAPVMRDRIDLTGGVRRRSENGRISFLMVEQALIDGRALKLFFPHLASVTFQSKTGAMPGWESKHLFWTYGSGNMKYLGYGEDGRFKLANYALSAGKYDLAENEVHIMLELRPNNPSLYLILGEIALKQGDEKKLETVLVKLEDLAAGEIRPGMATGVLNTLRRMAASKTGAR